MKYPDKYKSTRCNGCAGASTWTLHEEAYFPDGLGYKCECGHGQIPAEYLDYRSEWYMDVDTSD